MTKREKKMAQADMLADELLLRWENRIPEAERQTFVNRVRWSLRSASLELGEHLVANGVVERDPRYKEES